MKLMIMTDMEGAAGVLDYDQWCERGGHHYEAGKRLLTEEVNAAINGFYEGGATEIIVVDGHGDGGINPELLDDRVWLRSGRGEDKLAWGLDATFAGLAFVGQHAKSGTPYSHITHTGWFSRLDVQINGLSIGEYGQLALAAMEFAVPTILATGEQALADEATALTPGVVTVAVKRGLLPDGLDHLDCDAYRQAKLSAIHQSPRRARTLIRAAALQAIEKLKADPSSFRYPTLQTPYVGTCTYRKIGDTVPAPTREEHPNSILALLKMPFTDPADLR